MPWITWEGELYVELETIGTGLNGLYACAVESWEMEAGVVEALTSSVKHEVCNAPLQVRARTLLERHALRQWAKLML